MGSSIPPKIRALRDELFHAYVGLRGDNEGFDSTLRAFVEHVAAAAKEGEAAALDDYDHTKLADRVQLAILYAGFAKNFSDSRHPISRRWAVLPPPPPEGLSVDIPRDALRQRDVRTIWFPPSKVKDASAFDEFIKPDDAFFDRVVDIHDPAMYVREWRSFLKLFTYRALHLRRLMEIAEADPATFNPMVAHEINRIDRMLRGARAFHRYNGDELHGTWEYRFASIQRDRINNPMSALVTYGEVLDRRISIEYTDALRAAVYDTLKRFSDPFMHLRDLEPYKINGLPIRFEILTEGLDLHANSSPAAAIDKFQIKNEALRSFALRTAIDIITDRAAGQSLIAGGPEVSMLSLEWDPTRSEIRILNGNPAVRSLAAFEGEAQRRHLLRLRRRIDENSRIHFLRSDEPDGEQRIHGISIHIPPGNVLSNRFEPNGEEAASLGSAFRELAPEKWALMTDGQQDRAIESAAFFAADNGMEIGDISTEALDDFLNSAAATMPGILTGISAVR